MTIQTAWEWLKHRPKRWGHLQRVPISHLWSLLLAVFLLFSVIGFYIDVMSGGTLPYVLVIVYAVLSGLNATVWVLALAKLPRICVVILAGLEFLNGRLNSAIADGVIGIWHPASTDPLTGLHFSGTAILILIITSYSFFTRYMGMTGKEAFRIKNELELAHSIQKTLVPPITVTTAGFEIYGVSEPSEKVGGDLVDVVELPGGDLVAYLADIAGHGLQAGILMGMLKTAARTALANHDGASGAVTLSTLMESLNTVLPQVKEAHMYATFTALRLNADGQSFYGMAASPPLIHWCAATGSIRRVEEEQFPLGLLAVAEFPSSPLAMEPGDVVMIATDGILEVNSKVKAEAEDQFGVEALEVVVAKGARLPLPELAATVLASVRSYGRQMDDQTLLLVRRRMTLDRPPM